MLNPFIDRNAFDIAIILSLSEKAKSDQVLLEIIVELYFQ